MQKLYDVVVVGGGVTGSALLFALSRYTNIKSALLLEKYNKIAALNSNAHSNSQTLHFGDVETNYTVEKAKHVKTQAEYLLNYTKRFLKGDERDKIIQHCQKMVLGVGSGEVKALEKGYDSLKPVFPGLKKVNANGLAKIEPKVMDGRNRREEVLALLSNKGYMVDFGRLAGTFISNAKVNKKKKIDVKLGEPVIDAKRGNEYYSVHTRNGVVHAKFVAFEAGTYSLYFAKKFGYDKGLSILAIGGGFYYSKRMLRGKVYRVQHGGIPFAAIHADPDITDPKVTRYGPTVTIDIELEKGHPETIPDYISAFEKDIHTFETVRKILGNRDIQRIIDNNMLYSMPIIGKHRFVDNEARKIIPKIGYDDVWFDKSAGGIRPQIIDEQKRKLVLGEARLQREGLIFNITPSPGASSCVGNALEDASYITEYIDAEFDRELFNKEIGSRG